MYFADAVLQDLSRESEQRRIVSPERWLMDPPPSQQQVRIEEMSIEIKFSTVPQAASVATLLEQVDREARRIATAMERRVPTEMLRGRGVRLIPPRQGLAVEKATPGSLTLELLMGGLYTIVTSQPLSFALNLSALLGYGKVLVRAILPDGHEKSSEIEVSTERSSLHGKWDSPQPPTVLSTPHGPVVIPDGFKDITLHMKGADGTELYYESRPSDEPAS